MASNNQPADHNLKQAKTALASNEGQTVTNIRGCISRIDNYLKAPNFGKWHRNDITKVLMPEILKHLAALSDKYKTDRGHMRSCLLCIDQYLDNDYLVKPIAKKWLKELWQVQKNMEREAEL